MIGLANTTNKIFAWLKLLLLFIYFYFDPYIGDIGDIKYGCLPLFALPVGCVLPPYNQKRQPIIEECANFADGAATDRDRRAKESLLLG